jgi:hypothetical protein
LGHLNAGPVWTYPALYQGLDELLRDRHEVYRRGCLGSMATKADQNVLHEAVGQGANTDWPSHKAWVSEVSGDTDGLKQKRFTRKRVPGILPRRLRPTVVYQKNIYRIRGLFVYVHCGLGFIIRLRPDDFYEPPRAEPHAWWCGEGRLNAVSYPIRSCFSTTFLCGSVINN